MVCFYINIAGMLWNKNAGRKLLKQTGSLISTACEKTLQKLRNSFGSEKVDNIIRGFLISEIISLQNLMQFLKIL